MSLLLLLMVLAGLLRGLSALVVGSRILSDRAEALQTARTIQVVLRRELGRAWLPGDWALISDRTVALRAYRGLGYPCGGPAAVDTTATPGAPPFEYLLHVSFRGSRRPDPRKDSVAVVLQNGAALVADLISIGSGSCLSGPGLSIGLRTSRPLTAAPAAVRVFERLEYALVDSSFRLRRGRAGRQPLTASRLEKASHFRELGTVGLEAHVEFTVVPGANRPGGSVVLRIPGSVPGGRP